jgi:hypothetical protein
VEVALGDGGSAEVAVGGGEGIAGIETGAAPHAETRATSATPKPTAQTLDLWDWLRDRAVAIDPLPGSNRCCRTVLLSLCVGSGIEFDSIIMASNLVRLALPYRVAGRHESA